MLLLITPPFTQLNTPYPATAYLKGFLNTKNISSYQIDLGIEVILSIFSKEGLRDIFYQSNPKDSSKNAKRIFGLSNQYINTIDAVIFFLQGHNNSLARQICSENFLPQASRFDNLEDLDFVFGTMGLQDKAKHLATLYLEDLSDYIVECLDENFGFSRYAERLGRSANFFNPLYKALNQEVTYIDKISLHILKAKILEHQPDLVCISVPFPGNLYSAFRCGQMIKNHFPTIKIAMGGGFPNTELRSISDPRVFKYFDYITLDDGELPIELLCNQNISEGIFKRTFLLENGLVKYSNNSIQKDYKQFEVGTPDYSDLKLDKYISVIEIANPMHSLWSDGRWNKLTMAHGCYWGKCTFCDISLDYIKNYEPIAAKLLVDRMEEMIAQTGENGFHFVDEAAPPALMRDVALEILHRKLVVTWWTNIRFEKSFTTSLCYLLKQSGCIAVSGGLEVASDRLLDLIKKGVTVAQVAEVTQNFTKNGIMVHAYLMYGYPTQTVQETIDSLEMVRQMFEIGVLQSGFWHQFAMTAHSPVGMFPEEFGVIPKINNPTFAHNDIEFTDKTGINHNEFSFGLKKSLYNYMHNLCFDFDLQEWFNFKIPKTKIPKNYIENCLQANENFVIKPNAKIVWLGCQPIITHYVKTKKNQSWEMSNMIFYNMIDAFEINLEKEKAIWLVNILKQTTIDNVERFTFAGIKNDFEIIFEDFELFWFSKSIQKLRENGLLQV